MDDKYRLWVVVAAAVVALCSKCFVMQRAHTILDITRLSFICGICNRHFVLAYLCSIGFAPLVFTVRVLCSDMRVMKTTTK